MYVATKICIQSKYNRMRTFFFYSLLSLFFISKAIDLQAQTYHTKSFKMTISGTSSYHDWTSNVKNISLHGDFLFSNSTLEKIKNATALILTKSIQSEQKSDLMDERTHKTLKADQYPSITYEYLSIKSVQKESTQTNLVVNGTLTLAGTSKVTDLQMTLRTKENSEVVITGSKKIKMSEYGIRPPVFMLGLLRVGDEVTINYEVVLELKK
jgi:polyisoprenoid-binding protein YceI